MVLRGKYFPPRKLKIFPKGKVSCIGRCVRNHEGVAVRCPWSTLCRDAKASNQRSNMVCKYLRKGIYGAAGIALALSLSMAGPDVAAGSDLGSVGFGDQFITLSREKIEALILDEFEDRLSVMSNEDLEQLMDGLVFSHKPLREVLSTGRAAKLMEFGMQPAPSLSIEKSQKVPAIGTSKGEEQLEPAAVSRKPDVEAKTTSSEMASTWDEVQVDGMIGNRNEKESAKKELGRKQRPEERPEAKERQAGELEAAFPALSMESPNAEAGIQDKVPKIDQEGDDGARTFSRRSAELDAEPENSTGYPPREVEDRSPIFGNTADKSVVRGQPSGAVEVAPAATAVAAGTGMLGDAQSSEDFFARVFQAPMALKEVASSALQATEFPGPPTLSLPKRTEVMENIIETLKRGREGVQDMIMMSLRSAQTAASEELSYMGYMIEDFFLRNAIAIAAIASITGIIISLYSSGWLDADQQEEREVSPDGSKKPGSSPLMGPSAPPSTQVSSSQAPSAATSPNKVAGPYDTPALGQNSGTAFSEVASNLFAQAMKALASAARAVTSNGSDGGNAQPPASSSGSDKPPPEPAVSQAALPPWTREPARAAPKSAPQRIGQPPPPPPPAPVPVPGRPSGPVNKGLPGQAGGLSGSFPAFPGIRPPTISRRETAQVMQPADPAQRQVQQAQQSQQAQRMNGVVYRPTQNAKTGESVLWQRPAPSIATPMAPEAPDRVVFWERGDAPSMKSSAHVAMRDSGLVQPFQDVPRSNGGSFQDEQHFSGTKRPQSQQPAQNSSMSVFSAPPDPWGNADNSAK